MKHRGVFFDRDGVLNRNVFYADSGAFESPRRTADLQLFPHAGRALRTLKASGFRLFIVSNQPSYAKGKTTLEELRAVQSAVAEQIEAEGVRLDAQYYCFHHPCSTVPGYAVCTCRKPSPEFLLRACREFALDPEESWMVGDRATDIECGRRAGVRTIKMAPDHIVPDCAREDPRADFQAVTLQAAVDIILTRL